MKRQICSEVIHAKVYIINIYIHRFIHDVVDNQYCTNSKMTESRQMLYTDDTSWTTWDGTKCLTNVRESKKQ